MTRAAGPHEGLGDVSTGPKRFVTRLFQGSSSRVRLNRRANWWQPELKPHSTHRRRTDTACPPHGRDRRAYLEGVYDAQSRASPFGPAMLIRSHPSDGGSMCTWNLFIRLSTLNRPIGRHTTTRYVARQGAEAAPRSASGPKRRYMMAGASEDFYCSRVSSAPIGWRRNGHHVAVYFGVLVCSVPAIRMRVRVRYGSTGHGRHGIGGMS
jgi:hypothetical protein